VDVRDFGSKQLKTVEKSLNFFQNFYCYLNEKNENGKVSTIKQTKNKESSIKK